MARVLVVDDEQSVRTTLAEFLGDAGHEATLAADAETAISALRDGEFDVVVVDVVLPSLSGVDLLRLIRKMHPRVQVVLITGQPTLETAAEAVRERAFDYVAKPVSRDVLLNTIGNAARVKALEEEQLRLQEENWRYQEELSLLVDERTRELRESEARLREAQRLACMGDWDVDLANGQVVWSDELYRIMQVEPDVDLSSPTLMSGLTHPDDRARAAQAVQDAMATGELPPFEFRVIRADGEERVIWAKGEVVKNGHGAPVRFVGINQDITERKRMDERHRATISALPDFLFRLDRQGRFLEANAPTGRTFMMPPEQFLNKTVSEILPEAVAQQTMSAIEALFSTGETQTHEYAMDIDGRASVQEVRMVRCGRDEVLVLERDVTEQKRSVAALRESEERLRALVAELARVEERERRNLAIYLHDDISQDLALARMKFALLADDIRRGKRVTAGIEELRGLLDQAIENTQTLTFDLSPPVLHQLGLGAAIEWAGERAAEEHKLEFVFDDDGTEKPLGEDTRAFVFRAARELMTNVVKHAQATRMRATVTRRDGEVRVIIEDNGVGFGPAGDGSGPATTGFGMFSIRQRLEILGGTLEIQAAPGGGTRAVLSVPVEAD